MSARNASVKLAVDEALIDMKANFQTHDYFLGNDKIAKISKVMKWGFNIHLSNGSVVPANLIDGTEIERRIKVAK